MTNKEKAIEIINQAEQNHLNLYHDISKEEFKIYFDEFLKNADNLTNKEFDMEMLKLFSLFKDAHTQYYVPFGYLNKKLFYIENTVFLKHHDEYKKVICIGNMKIQDVIKHISSMQTYETKEYLNDSIRYDLNNQYYYDMLNLTNDDESIDCVIENNGQNEVVNIKKICRDEYIKLGYRDDSPFYQYKILNDDILLIKYRKCSEHEDYPFSLFVEEIKQQVKTKNIQQYILDLRDNHGGNSSIINPLTQAVKELELDGVLLIDNGVFSSGRWAVADFKREFNAILIGEPTGGAAASYGYNKNLKVEDKSFSVSIRYWDFSDVFGYKGSIQPDIFVPITIKDFKEKKDPQLTSAIDYLTKTKEKNHFN